MFTLVRVGSTQRRLGPFGQQYSCTHAYTVAQTSHLLLVVRCGPHRSSLSNSTFSRTSCMHRRMCPDSRTTLAAVQLLYRTTERRSKQRPLLSRRCLVSGSQLLYSAYAVLLIRSREYCEYSAAAVGRCDSVPQPVSSLTADQSSACARQRRHSVHVREPRPEVYAACHRAP